jgi:ABC-2 type transport system ATP-binding protein
MTVRLGFAIAIHSNSEILLADEVLAVGDLSFALKCHRKISEYRENGGSIILVSHGMQLIRNVCNQVLWMDLGKQKMIGETQSICDLYEADMFRKDSSNAGSDGRKINNDDTARISNVQFLDEKGIEKKNFVLGKYFKMRINFSCSRNVRLPIFTFGILNMENITLISNYSNFDMKERIKSIDGRGYVDVEIPKLMIKPGVYYITVTLAENELANVLDWHEKCYSVTVEGNKSDVAYGLLQIPLEWKLNS